MRIHVEIDTLADEFGDRELAVLAALSGTPVAVVEPAPEPEKPKAPAKKAPAKKAAPKPKPEPVEEPEETEEEEPEETEEEITLETAVNLATEMVDKGKMSVVKAALVDLGVKRVSELKGDDIAAFVEAVRA